MISISAKKRIKLGKNSRQGNLLPGVLYGPEIKNQPIEVDPKKFKKVFGKVGESSLFALDIDEKKFYVLIHEVQKDSVSGEFIHVDFYQPILTKKVEARVPLVFEGEAPAVKDLAGTLVKEFQEVEVSALPKDLPHEIKVDVSKLKTFEDEILVKDLEVPKGAEIIKEQDAIVASVLPPEKVDEELEKPIEEKVDEVEVEEKEKKEEETADNQEENKQ